MLSAIIIKAISQSKTGSSLTVVPLHLLGRPPCKSLTTNMEFFCAPPNQIAVWAETTPGCWMLVETDAATSYKCIIL